MNQHPESNKPPGGSDSGPVETSSISRTSAWGKLTLFILLGLSLFFLFSYTEAGQYFKQEHLREIMDRLGMWAPVGFVAIYAAGTMLAIPGTIMTALGGILFGPLFGTTLIVVGATIGASGAFFIGRYLARDAIERRFGSQPWLKRLDEGIANEGIYFVLFLRLVPVFPFNGINFATGLTKISFRDYFIGTAVGIIPATYVFANAAYQAAEAAGGKGVSAGFFVSLALLGLIALIPIIYKKFKRDKSDGVES